MVVLSEMLNFAAELMVYWLTYIVVGLYYDRGSNPTIGIVLYLACYVGVNYLRNRLE